MRERSKIADLYPLAHLSQTLRELLDEVHFYIKVDREIGILMRGVDRSADIKINVGSLLKQQAADERCSVPTIAPLRIKLVSRERVAGILNYLVHGDNSLRNEVNALYLRGRGNIPALENQARY